MKLFCTSVECELGVLAFISENPEPAFLAALVLPCVVVVVRDLVRIMARKGCRPDKYGAEKAGEAIVAVGGVIEQGDRVVSAADAAFNRGSVLVWFFFAVGLSFENAAGNFCVDSRLCKCGWDFKLQHLFVLVPVDDKA